MAVIRLPEYVVRSVARLRSGARKRRLLRQAAEARDRSKLKGERGRAWINGREVDGTGNRHVHVMRSHH